MSLCDSLARRYGEMSLVLRLSLKDGKCWPVVENRNGTDKIREIWNILLCLLGWTVTIKIRNGWDVPGIGG